MTQASKQKRRGRYAEKKRLGLVPHIYDKNSRSFQAGAWKNWNDRELRERAAFDLAARSYTMSH